jgi:hypothetical protein
MDSEKPGKPSNLLSDLESIRQLLEQSPLEPPLLTELFDPNSIPLLSDIVHPAELGAPIGKPTAPASLPVASAPAAAPVVRPPPTAAPATPSVRVTSNSAAAAHAAMGEHLQLNLHPAALELNRLDRELRTAAQLMLQDVIDDFVPQIEAELKRRLDLQLTLLLNQRKR